MPAYFPPTFFPPPPNPSIPARIARLRTFLDPASPTYWRVEWHVNIRKAISMYETGELDGVRRVWIKKGEVVSKAEAWRGPECCWCEVSERFPSNLYRPIFGV